MRYYITLILLLFSLKIIAQTDYEVIWEEGNPRLKILKGTIDKNLIQNDTTFKWYAPNYQSYQVDSIIIKSFLKVNVANIQFIIFAGTWCGDTQYILPKFFKLQEMSGIPDERITLFGVDRKKIAPSHIAEALGISSVPTIIVLKGGKELGRVVEYGKTGNWDAELAEIIERN